VSALGALASDANQIHALVLQHALTDSAADQAASS
jgi:hypothetical protein